MAERRIGDAVRALCRARPGTGQTRQMDPRFAIPRCLGSKGWMSPDVSRGGNARELREQVIGSYRHFASRRALQTLSRTAAAS